MSERTAYFHGQFCWIDLVAHDMKAAAEFYTSAFGWTTRNIAADGGPDYLQFEKDEKAVGGIGQMSDEMKSHGVPQMWNSYVNVDDVNKAVEKAASLGATVTVPPMQIAEAGWMAYITDPAGAPLGLWQKNQHFGARLVNVADTWCWNESATRGLDKSKSFYAELFGWTYKENTESPAPYFIAESNAARIGGMIQMTEEWGDTPPHWGVYFNTADLNATLEKIKAAGGKSCCDPFPTPVGPMTTVMDPQNGAFNLIQLNPDAID